MSRIWKWQDRLWQTVDTMKLTLRLGWAVALMIIFWQAIVPNPQGVGGFLNDKMLHVIAFLLLGMWAQLGWTHYQHRIRLLGFLVFYGIAIECVQYFVPGRFFSLMDWLADILGLGIAVWLIWRMNKARNYSPLH